MNKSLGMKAKCAVAAVLFGLGGTYGVAQAVPFAIGDIFASTSNGNVQHLNSAGTLLETLNNGVGGFTTGSAFDSAGNLYLTDFSNNTVTKFLGAGDPHTRSVFASGISTPESVVIAGNGNILIGSLGNGIREYNSAGTLVGTTLLGTRVDWFDLAADQSTILYTQEGGVVHTGTRGVAAPGANFSNVAGDFALRILPGAGGVLVANNENVVLLNSSGAIVRTYDVTGIDGFFALNLSNDGTSFLTGSFQNGAIYRFNIATGGLDVQTQTISTGCGQQCLFGLSVFGEVTVGNPPPDTVPEPATLMLVGLGLAGLAAARRKRA